MNLHSCAALAPKHPSNQGAAPLSVYAEMERLGLDTPETRAIRALTGKSATRLLLETSRLDYCGAQLLEEHLAPVTIATGSTRSGKTVLTDRLAFSMLQGRMASTILRHRGFIAEARPGMLQKLRGTFPADQLVILDPTIEGSSAPHYPALLDGQWHAAFTFALALVADLKTGGDADSWVKYAAQYITAIVQVFLTSGADWDLLDLITGTMTYSDGLIRRHHPYGPQFIDKFVRRNAMGENVRQVATGALLTFQDQAFTARQCEYRWDVRDWAERGGVVVVCLDPEQAEAKLPIVRLLTTFAVNAVLGRARPEGIEPLDKSVFYLDEVQDLRLPVLGKAVRMGGAKGLVNFLTFQSLPGLVLGYGSDEAADIVANSGNLIVTRQECKTSADTWSDALGSYEWFEPNPSISSNSESISWTRHFEANVPAEVLMSFPRASFEHGIRVAHKTPAYPGACYTVQPEWLRRTAPKALSAEKTYRRRPSFAPRLGDELLTWSEADFARLGLPPIPPDSDSQDPLAGSRGGRGIKLPDGL